MDVLGGQQECVLAELFSMKRKKKNCTPCSMILTFICQRTRRSLHKQNTLKYNAEQQSNHISVASIAVISFTVNMCLLNVKI